MPGRLPARNPSETTISGPRWSSAFHVEPELAGALSSGKPVVFLETAVVSHGLPDPHALEVAAALQAEVREGCALPAAVAVLDGKVVVGASTEQLARLRRPEVWKVASRDLSVAVAYGAPGGLTVSATVAVADALGAAVVATGGVGGVHLGAQQTWDVSSDLRALAEHPVAVVCSGAKAVCDPSLTLEALDTLGVTVLSYGTDWFPHFYAGSCGLRAPRRVDSPQQVARVLQAKRALGQRSGLLVANPVPSDAALPLEDVTAAVRLATARAAEEGVRGPDLTPYLLSALSELTGGRALRANTALLRANARLAVQVAVALAELASG